MTRPGEGFDSAALDRARLAGFDVTAGALAEGLYGLPLAAAILEHVCAQPFPELKWAALDGVAVALAEVEQGG